MYRSTSAINAVPSAEEKEFPATRSSSSPHHHHLHEELNLPGGVDHSDPELEEANDFDSSQVLDFDGDGFDYSDHQIAQTRREPALAVPFIYHSDSYEEYVQTCSVTLIHQKLPDQR